MKGTAWIVYSPRGGSLIQRRLGTRKVRCLHREAFIIILPISLFEQRVCTTRASIGSWSFVYHYIIALNSLQYHQRSTSRLVCIYILLSQVYIDIGIYCLLSSQLALSYP